MRDDKEYVLEKCTQFLSSRDAHGSWVWFWVGRLESMRGNSGNLHGGKVAGGNHMPQAMMLYSATCDCLNYLLKLSGGPGPL